MFKFKRNRKSSVTYPVYFVCHNNIPEQDGATMWVANFQTEQDARKACELLNKELNSKFYSYIVGGAC